MHTQAFFRLTFVDVMCDVTCRDVARPSPDVRDNAAHALTCGGSTSGWRHVGNVAWQGVAKVTFDTSSHYLRGPDARRTAGTARVQLHAVFGPARQ